jgi:hypothetical protein
MYGCKLLHNKGKEMLTKIKRSPENLATSEISDLPVGQLPAALLECQN